MAKWETDYQLDVVKAVEQAGGAAHKLSNRFLIGVSDLLIKMPTLPAMLIEVKKNDYPKKSHIVDLEVTAKQHQFLLKYAKVGMQCGVLSFLISKENNKRVVHAAVFSVIPSQTTFNVSTGSYRRLGQGGEFYPSIVHLLIDDWS